MHSLTSWKLVAGSDLVKLFAKTYIMLHRKSTCDSFGCNQVAAVAFLHMSITHLATAFTQQPPEVANNSVSMWD